MRKTEVWDAHHATSAVCIVGHTWKQDSVSQLQLDGFGKTSEDAVLEIVNAQPWSWSVAEVRSDQHKLFEAPCQDKNSGNPRMVFQCYGYLGCLWIVTGEWTLKSDMKSAIVFWAFHSKVNFQSILKHPFLQVFAHLLSFSCSTFPIPDPRWWTISFEGSMGRSFQWPAWSCSLPVGWETFYWRTAKFSRNPWWYSKRSRLLEIVVQSSNWSITSTLLLLL